MPLALDAGDLMPGFADPVRDSQQAFRAALDALAYPGRIVQVPERAEAPPLNAAQAALALALVDFETPVWLDAATSDAAGWLRFHCGCPIVANRAEARFAFVGAPEEAPPLSTFDAGSDEYPDRSATLILAVRTLSATGPIRLDGPGIQEEAAVGIEGLPPAFWREWADNRTLFPRGVDVFLTAGSRILGLPRTIRARS